MNLVSIEDVKSGMILARDVINDLGIIFMSAGSEINSASIASLKKLDIDFVYVEEADQAAAPSVDEHITMEQAYTRLMNLYKSIYANVGLGKSLNLDQLKRETLPLFKKITEDNNVLNSLRRVGVHDSYSYIHSVNVAILAMIIGKWLNLKTHIQEDLAIAGFLHDIGKTNIPLDILDKPGELTVSEFEKIKEHPIHGYRILQISTGVTNEIMEAVKHHHERIDGSGYPDGLRDREISLYAKILAVADVFDAITANKSYRSKISVYAAARVLKTESFNKLEPKVTEVFLKNISRFYVGNKVKLNTGEIGEVILLNKTDVTRPLIKIGEMYFDLSTNYKLEIVDVVG
ncbi:MAG: HD-GYP domain-containing protein [Clostridia bacterium]|nr:HD-GYP domain-containing protein [Clostridia bacterium]